jgi:hypothetical protein
LKPAYASEEDAMPLLQIDGEVIAIIGDSVATKLRSAAKIGIGRETEDVPPGSALTPGSLETKIATDDPSATETVKMSLTFVKDRWGRRFTDVG